MGFTLDKIYFSGADVRIAEAQNKAIRTHLEQGRTIDSMMALRMYGVSRLAARIFDLRKTMSIKSVTVRSGKKHFSQYSLNK